MKCLVDFKEYLSYERNLADNTVASYLYFVSEFISFASKDVMEIQRDDIKDFIKYLRVRDLQNSSISAYVIALRSFYKWLAYTNKSEVLLQVNFFLNNIVRIRKERSVRAVVTTDELSKIREAIATHKAVLSCNKKSNFYRIVLRDAAIIEMLACTGCRSEELREIRVRDIDFENKTVLIRKGKGGHQRVALFNESARIALKEHIAHNGYDLDARISVIRTPNMLGYIVKRWAKAANLGKNIYPHSFRHHHITEAQRKGIPIQAVADQVGHVNLNTTRMYTHLDLEYRKEEYSRRENNQNIS